MVSDVTLTSFDVATDVGMIAGWESGTGPAVLFLHGGPGVSEYGHMLDAEAAGWRFITFQQRGLSPSATCGPHTMDQNVADAIAVLDSRGADRAVVAGHSFGAHFALHLAVAHPDRVAGLVLIDGLGVVGDGGLDEFGQAMTERMLPPAAQRLRQIEDELGGREPDDETDREMFALEWPSYFVNPLKVPPFVARAAPAVNEAVSASVSEHLSAGFAGRLAELSVPAIFVLGAQSPMPVTQGEQTAALIAGAEVRIIPAAGHLPWWEKPGCVAAALASVQETLAPES
jgi:proline iminopeptidase